MNLSQRPPRSPRVRLGGYVLLPRLLDKCRAELAGTPGDFHYNCPMDQRFFEFAGVDHEALKSEVAKGGGDGELLAWILTHRQNHHSPWEIAQWSAAQEVSVPTDNESRELFSKMVAQAGGATREDIGTWFEYLDLDDHVSFGGKA